MIFENALTVTQITREIIDSLEKTFSDVLVVGEISNFKQHTSGHRYFTLKDESSSVSCTMWKSKSLSFIPSDGMKVIVSGRITVYPPRGSYQIECESIVPIGSGDLFLEFERLKQKLSDKGYFSQDIKKNLPQLPMSVGVSTSPTGAAVKDIFSTIERRFPATQIYFRPTIVQGENAIKDISDAILQLDELNLDIIIIGRGGGSLEDLWAYNSELTANAIFNCNTPIISAVGHETDFTIADFVADVRAATPTAAAELATPVTNEFLLDGISNYLDSMNKNIMDLIDDKRKKIDDLVAVRHTNRLFERINLANQTIDEHQTRIKSAIERKFNKNSDDLAAISQFLRSLYPLSPLGKGFALLKSGDDIINSRDTLGNYLEIDIIRANETAKANIVKIFPKNNYKE